jgi:hypothetical protein
LISTSVGGVENETVIAGGVTAGTVVRTSAFVGAGFEDTNAGAVETDFFVGLANPFTGKENAICKPTKATLRSRTVV